MAITKLILSPVAKTKGCVSDSLMVDKSEAYAASSSSSPSCPRQIRRSVSFDESLNVRHANEQCDRDECRALWYSAFDYRQMKESSRSAAKQIARCEARMATDNSSAESFSSYSKIMLHVYDLCCVAKTEELTLQEQDQALFQEAIGRSNRRFGIEKCVIREMAYDKRYRRAALVDVVGMIQANFQGSNDAKTNLLRRSSESLTRASRLYALVSATALAESM